MPLYPYPAWRRRGVNPYIFGARERPRPALIATPIAQEAIQRTPAIELPATRAAAPKPARRFAPKPARRFAPKPARRFAPKPALVAEPTPERVTERAQAKPKIRPKRRPAPQVPTPEVPAQMELTPPAPAPLPSFPPFQPVEVPTPPEPRQLTPPPEFVPPAFLERPFAEYLEQARAEYVPLAEAALSRLRGYEEEATRGIFSQLAARGVLRSGLAQAALERLAGEIGREIGAVESELQARVGERAGQLQAQAYERYMSQRQQAAIEYAQRFSRWEAMMNLEHRQAQDIFMNQMLRAGFQADEAQRARDYAITQREQIASENARAFSRWVEGARLSLDQAYQHFAARMSAAGFSQSEIQRSWENQRRIREFEAQMALERQRMRLATEQQAAEMALRWAQLAQRGRPAGPPVTRWERISRAK